jgi:hypothetical protein
MINLSRLPHIITRKLPGGIRRHCRNLLARLRTDFGMTEMGPLSDRRLPSRDLK